MRSRTMAVVALAGVLALSACKTKEQAQVEADAAYRAQLAQQAHQLKLQQQQWAHEHQLNQIRAETARQAAAQQAAVDKARNEKIGDVAELIGAIAVICGLLAALGYWVRIVANKVVEETQKTTRFKDAIGVIADPNNGLSQDQREALVVKAIEASRRPLLLTHEAS